MALNDGSEAGYGFGWLVSQWRDLKEVSHGGDIVTIFKKNNQLFIQSKLGEVEIYAETEIQFFLKDNTTIRFTKENGKVTEMVMDTMDLGRNREHTIN